MVMAYAYEVERILRIVEEAGADMPLRFIDEQVMKNRLEDLLETIYDEGFNQGEASVDYTCYEDCCY